MSRKKSGRKEIKIEKRLVKAKSKILRFWRDYLSLFSFIFSSIFFSVRLTGNSILSSEGTMASYLGAGFFLLGILSLGMALMKHKKDEKLGE